MEYQRGYDKMEMSQMILGAVVAMFIQSEQDKSVRFISKKQIRQIHSDAYEAKNKTYMRFFDGRGEVFGYATIRADAVGFGRIKTAHVEAVVGGLTMFTSSMDRRVLVDGKVFTKQATPLIPRPRKEGITRKLVITY